MEAKELMIGDLVYVSKNFTQKYHKIRALSNDEGAVLRGIYVNEYGVESNSVFSPNDIEPIPITPEILEKNGFTQCEPQGYDLYVKDKKGAGLYNILWQGESYNYYLEISAYTYPFGEFNKTNIKYVHQLQHALRLCGIEKEIIL